MSGLPLLWTEWRVKATSPMTTRAQTRTKKAIDSLLNYETVKYFVVKSNAKHSGYTRRWRLRRGGDQDDYSLAFLDFGPVLLITAGWSA